MQLRTIALCTIGLIAAGCAATQLSSSPKAPSWSPTKATVGSTAKEAPGREEPFDLTAFRPLLAEDENLEARQKLEAGDSKAAAALLLPAGGVRDAREAARAFLAGRLYGLAGDSESAKKAFSEAARIPWALQEDAALRAAEACLALSQASEARVWLDAAANLAGEARYVRAEARVFRENGDRAASAQAFLRAFELEPRSSELFELAETLLGPGGETRELGEVEVPLLTRLVRELRIQRARQDKESSETKIIDAYLARLPSAPVESRERIVELELLIQKGRSEEALALVETLEKELKGEPEFGALRCDLRSQKAKALSLAKRWGDACDVLLPATTRCKADPAAHARILFNAGKFAAADGRDATAVKLYAELEQSYPSNSLADDARLRAARSYRDMGAMARYTDLLMKMPEDYPEGDMTSEGVVELALYYAQRGDWGAAALILSRGADLVRGRDAARGTEFAGTERYFLARARAETKDGDAALDEYESIVQEIPLSYYMLHAFTRLYDADKERARKALQAGLDKARATPFSFPTRPEYRTPGFRRGLELLRAGDVAEGRRVLSTLGLHEGAEDSLVWGIALLYDRAGDAQTAHSIARGRLTDWLGHYPEGPWRTPWEIGFPRPYYGVVSRESKATSVSEALIYGVMREESTFDPSAESPARAYGLMQVIEPTARAIGRKAGLPHTKAALLKPEVNIALGSRVLAELLKRFDQRVELAIPGYNAGPGRPARWLRERSGLDFDIWVETIPIRETRRYTKRVLASRAAYDFLYGEGGGEQALLLPRTMSP